MNNRIRVFTPKQYGVYFAIDGEDYDFKKNYGKLFGSAYVDNFDLSSEEFKNGNNTQFEMERYNKIITNEEEAGENPKQDEEGFDIFPPYKLMIHDSDLAEVKPSKTGKEKKTVKDAKEDKPFRNKLECLAKSVSDKFKLTSSSPPVQKWKTGVEEKAASLT